MLCVLSLTVLSCGQSSNTARWKELEDKKENLSENSPPPVEQEPSSKEDKDDSGDESNEWLRRGQTRVDLEDYDRAIECFKMAVELNPKNDIAWSFLGLAYYIKGDDDKAIKYYQKAIKLSPKNDGVLSGMGLTYYRKGDYDKTIEYCGKANARNQS